MAIVGFLINKQHEGLKDFDLALLKGIAANRETVWLNIFKTKIVERMLAYIRASPVSRSHG